MCFGNDQSQTTQTYTPPHWLTSAATGNLDYVKNLRDQGFQGYAGNQVANFSPEQQASFYAAGGLAGSVAPYTGEIGSLANNFSNAGPASVTPSSIASNMSPYMNAYVTQALQPQLEGLRQQFAGQNKSFDSAATGAGAFGDSSWNLGRTNLTNQQNIGMTGLLGNAYNAAFNTAIGAGAQDSANSMNAQTTNANLYETALQRQLAGANFLYGTGSGTANLQNQFGAQQTAQGQAGLNAAYNQWLMAQQYPFQTAGLMNQTIGAAKTGAPTTTVTSAPNNAGFGLLGSAVGAAGTAAGGYFTGQGLQSVAAAQQPAQTAAEGGPVDAYRPLVVGDYPVKNGVGDDPAVKELQTPIYTPPPLAAPAQDQPAPMPAPAPAASGSSGGGGLGGLGGLGNLASLGKLFGGSASGAGAGATDAAAGAGAADAAGAVGGEAAGIGLADAGAGAAAGFSLMDLLPEALLLLREGGSLAKNRAALVGDAHKGKERGKHIFVPRKPGTVVSNDTIEAARATKKNGARPELFVPHDGSSPEVIGDKPVTKMTPTPSGVKLPLPRRGTNLASQLGVAA